MTPRHEPPPAADERESLSAFLDFLRATIEMKAEGLSDEQARWSPVPTGTSIMGIVRHLAEVERGWFRRRFVGEDLGHRYRHDDPDGDFHPGPADRLDEALSAYAEEQRRAREIVASAHPGELSAREGRAGERVSLRWILIHMIEETARHAGHADLIREMIDGSTGE